MLVEVCVVGGFEPQRETNTCLCETFRFLRTKGTVQGDLRVEQCNEVIVMWVVSSPSQMFRLAWKNVSTLPWRGSSTFQN